MDSPILALPEELLERIFLFTSQYRDYSSISLVCVKWNRIIRGMRVLHKSAFDSCFVTGRISWNCYESKFAPTPRHSHSSVIIRDVLYVFGGLSGSFTSYNDLWMFDLSRRMWARPSSSGAYPSPKGASTMIAHGDSILLYGGYSHPFSNSFNQHVNFFDELHIYCTRTHKWRQVVSIQETPKLAGHSASVIKKNLMILFGGCDGSLGNKTNDIFCFNMDTNEWANEFKDAYRQASAHNRRPESRYGQSQVSLDDERVLVVGGNSGPNKQLDDIWLLVWGPEPGAVPFWQQIRVRNLFNAPFQSYSISFARSRDKLITFGKPRVLSSDNLEANRSMHSLFGTGAGGGLYYDSDHELYTITGVQKMKQIRQCTCSQMPVVVNEKATSLVSQSTSLKAASSSRPKSLSSLTSPSSSSAARNGASSAGPAISSSSVQLNESQMKALNKSQHLTIKRLEALKKIADNLNKINDSKKKIPAQCISHQLSVTSISSQSQASCVVHSKVMQVFSLDISSLLHETDAGSGSSTIDDTVDLSVQWQLPIAHFVNAPPHSILFSVNQGVDEIILFAGMELGIQQVNNKLFFMRPNELDVKS